MQGASWLVLRTEGPVMDAARRTGRVAWVAFVVLWLIVTAFSVVDAPDLWVNYGNPLAWIVPLLFVVATAVTGIGLWGDSDRLPIVGSSLSIAALIAILGQALYPTLVPDRTGTRQPDGHERVLVRAVAVSDACHRLDRHADRAGLHAVRVSPLHAQGDVTGGLTSGYRPSSPISSSVRRWRR